MSAPTGFDSLFTSVRARCLLETAGTSGDDVKKADMKTRAFGDMVASSPYVHVPVNLPIQQFCLALDVQRLTFADRVSRAQSVFEPVKATLRDKDNTVMRGFPGSDDPGVLSAFVRAALADRDRRSTATSKLAGDAKVPPLADDASNVMMNICTPLSLALSVRDEVRYKPLNAEDCFELWSSGSLEVLRSDLLARRMADEKQHPTQFKMNANVCEFLYMLANMAHLQQHRPVTTAPRLLAVTKRIAAETAYRFWDTTPFKDSAHRKAVFDFILKQADKGEWYDHNDRLMRGRVLAAVDRGDVGLIEKHAFKVTSFSAKEFAAVIREREGASAVKQVLKRPSPTRAQKEEEDEKRPNVAAGFGLERAPPNRAMDLLADELNPKESSPSRAKSGFMSVVSYRERFADAYMDVPAMYRVARRFLSPALESAGSEYSLPALFDLLKHRITSERVATVDSMRNPVRTDDMPIKGRYWHPSRLERTLGVLKSVYEDISMPTGAKRIHTPPMWVRGPTDQSGDTFVSTWEFVSDEHKTTILRFLETAIKDAEALLFSAAPLDKIEMVRAKVGYLNDLLALMPLSPEASNPIECAMRTAPDCDARYVDSCYAVAESFRQSVASVLLRRAECETLALSTLSTVDETKTASERDYAPVHGLPLIEVVHTAAQRTETTRAIETTKRYQAPQSLHIVPLEWTSTVTIRAAFAYTCETAAPAFVSCSIATFYMYTTARLLAKQVCDWMAHDLLYATLRTKPRHPIVNIGASASARMREHLLAFATAVSAGIEKDVFGHKVNRRAVAETVARHFIDSQISSGRSNTGLSFLITRCAQCYITLAREYSKTLFPGLAPGLIDERVFRVVFMDHFIKKVIPQWHIFTGKAAEYLSSLPSAGFAECKDTMGSDDMLKRHSTANNLRIAINRDVWTNSNLLLKPDDTNRTMLLLTKALRGDQSKKVDVPDSIRALLSIAVFPWIAESFLAAPKHVMTGQMREILHRCVFEALFN